MSLSDQLIFSNLITNLVCVKEIRNINYAIPFLYLNYGQRMPDLCNLHAYLMFQVRPRSEGEFLGQIEENLTHPPEPSKTNMCWLNKPKYHILSSQKILSPEKSGSLLFWSATRDGWFGVKQILSSFKTLRFYTRANMHFLWVLCTPERSNNIKDYIKKSL